MARSMIEKEQKQRENERKEREAQDVAFIEEMLEKEKQEKKKSIAQGKKKKAKLQTPRREKPSILMMTLKRILMNLQRKKFY